MTEIDPNEVLFGSGVPGFKFLSYGDTCRGIITEIKAGRQTDMKTGEPKFWPSGDPMYQVIVTVQTQERDPSIQDDDGKRRLFIKGRNLTDGVRDAVRNAGAKKLALGALISVTFTGEGQAERGSQPPKLYTVEYQVLGAQQPAAARPAVSGGTYATPAPQAAQQAPVATEAPSGTAPGAGSSGGMVDVSSLPEAAQQLIAQMQAAAQSR
jgi:hypothetical protein